MEECEQGSRFYFRVTESFDRIMMGDIIEVDTKCEITPCSIVLTYPDFILQKVDLNPLGEFIGKVVNVYIQQ
jgi:hypothetical protein